jgi:hypothetical protein
LLGDELENQNSIFLKLDKEVIEMLKEYELKEIVIRSKQEVDSLVKKGIDIMLKLVGRIKKITW